MIKTASDVLEFLESELLRHTPLNNLVRDGFYIVHKDELRQIALKLWGSIYPGADAPDSPVLAQPKSD